MLIVIEGISGSGKSTIAKLVAQQLSAYLLHTVPEPFQGLTPTINAELAPLPQLAFYLAGLCYASDLIRKNLTVGPVVADRYRTSVIANHAAVHGLVPQQVLDVAEPWMTYLIEPTLTVYLRTSPAALAERLARKADLTESDRFLFAETSRYQAVQRFYDLLGTNDPSAWVLDTDDASPEQLTKLILDKAATFA